MISYRNICSFLSSVPLLLAHEIIWQYDFCFLVVIFNSNAAAQMNNWYAVEQFVEIIHFTIITNFQ